MSTMPNDSSKKFFELLKLVEKRLFEHNQSLTINKTKVLELLFESKDHLSVEDIINYTKDCEQKLTSTTVYRVLSSFEHLGIVDSIMINERKRYELSYFKQPHYHLLCSHCNKIIEFENDQIYKLFLEELSQIDFQAISFNVIVNGICKDCKNIG